MIIESYIPPAVTQSLVFLQGGAVAERLRGVNSRFESGNGGLDKNVVFYAIAILGSILTVVLIRRVVLWNRWCSLAGSNGLGLDRESLQLWWKHLSLELRQEPNKLFDSKERMGAELEKLVDVDKSDLARKIHKLWLKQRRDVAHPLNSIENLLQTEFVAVRGEDGRTIYEGFLRRVGQDAVDVVPFKKLPPLNARVGSENVDLIRARGCEPVLARIIKVSPDGRLWTFSVGEAAKVAHQRLEFRIKTGLGALLFSKRLKTIEEMQREYRGIDKPRHHLIEKQRRESKMTYAKLMEQKKLFFSADLVHLVDLSALGVRLRMKDTDDFPDVDRPLYLYMPFDVGSQELEFIVRGTVVETWLESSEDEEAESRILRIRFFDLDDAEIQELRTLCNQLNAAGPKSTFSRAEEFAEQFKLIPLK